MGYYLTHALDENNRLVHVDDVAKGNNCNCHCPNSNCKSPLCAKNAGQVRVHHFAHAHGHECEGAYESQLHLLAKEVLQEAGRIMLPRSNECKFPSGVISIRNVEIEKWDDRYGIRPDAEGIMENGERLLIEFYVTHKVDSEKRKIILDNNLKCLEIYINYQAPDKAELKRFLCDSDQEREWIESTPTHVPSGKSTSYSRDPMYNKVRDILKSIFDEGTIIIHPFDNTSKGYDLRQFGYDECHVNTKWKGFKSDLLLYRSKKAKEGYISINIRGRSRRDEPDGPEGLKIIDIVFKAIGTEESIRQRLNKGDLQNDLGMTVEYYGFKEKH